jgi:hypothetical protein
MTSLPYEENSTEVTDLVWSLFSLGSLHAQEHLSLTPGLVGLYFDD